MYVYICSQITAASDWPRLFLHPRCFCLVNINGHELGELKQHIKTYRRANYFRGYKISRILKISL